MTTEVNSTQLSALADAVQNAAESASSAKKRGRKAKVDAPVADAAKVEVPAANVEVPSAEKKKTKKTSKKDVDVQPTVDAKVESKEDAPKKKPLKKKDASVPASGGAPVSNTVPVPSVDADAAKVKKPRAKKDKTAAVDASPAAVDVSPADAEKPKRKKRAKKDKTDDGQPKKKRAMGPYMLFAQSIRAQLKQDNPTLKVTELAKLTGQRWGALNAEEKQKFAPAKPVESQDASAVPAQWVLLNK